MILFVNDKSEVHDVNTTEDVSLTPLYVNESDPTFPFAGWSIAKICCYKVTVVEGVVTMMTPYVDSTLIDHIDQLGKQIEAVVSYQETKTAYIDDTEVVFEGIPNGPYYVSFDKPIRANRVTKEDLNNGTSTITVEFDPLEEVTKVTITIQ